MWTPYLISTPSTRIRRCSRWLWKPGKDVYCESHGAMCLAEAKAARDAVWQANGSSKSAPSPVASHIKLRRAIFVVLERWGCHESTKSSGTITGPMAGPPEVKQSGPQTPMASLAYD